MRAAAIAILTIPIAATPARAQEAAEIAYEAPPECPDAAEIRRRLAEHLRSAPASVALPRIEARVRITGAFEAEIVLIDAGIEARRTITDRSCELVADAAALVIAIALVPDLALGALAEPRAGPTARPQERSDEPAGALWIAAHGSIGVLPGIVLGGELGGAVRIGSLRLEVAARGVPLVGARFAIHPSLGGDLAIALGLVRAIAAIAIDPVLEIRLGGGLEAGALLGRGVGISVPRDTAAPWVAIEAAAGLAWVPEPLIAVVLEFEALAPIVRPVLTVSGLGILYRPEPVAGALRLALELRVR